MNKLRKTFEDFVAWLFSKNFEAEFRAKQEAIDKILNQCLARQKQQIHPPMKL